MTILITMAGLGARFSQAGYCIPKYKIIARGRSLFEWSMLSLRKFFEQEFVFATLSGVDDEWLMSHAIKLGINRCRIIARPALSSGQAETAYDVSRYLDASEPLWIYNIDTYVESGLTPSDMEGFAGCIHVFKSMDPRMSFVHYDNDCNVDAVAEKSVISNWASVGMYGFESVSTFRSAYENAYENRLIKVVNGERYIVPIYEVIFKNGKRVCAPKIDASKVRILGTPIQVLDFDPQALPPFGSTTEN